MIINRGRVIARLMRGEKLKETGNVYLFHDGSQCSASTQIYLLDNKLVKKTGEIAHTTLTWNH